MTRKALLPQRRRHILVFDEDWTYLSARYGPGGLSPVGISPIIRAIIHKQVRDLKAKETAERDKIQ